MSIDYSCLEEIRTQYSKLLIKAGLCRLKRFPEEDAAEFIECFFLPREEILRTLREKRKKQIFENLNAIIDKIKLKLEKIDCETITGRQKAISLGINSNDNSKTMEASKTEICEKCGKKQTEISIHVQRSNSVSIFVDGKKLGKF